MVPTHNHLWSVHKLESASHSVDSPSGLFQHVQHFRLKHMVDRLDGHSRSALRHGEDVHA